jgi:mevalonate kinase
MTLDNENYDLRYLIALINSKLICWQFRSISTSVRGGYWRYTKQYVEKIPIYPATPEEQQTFIEKTDKMLQLNKKLKEEVNDFNSWIQKEFGIDKLSQKLEKYYKLSEDEFMDELRKKKVDTKDRKNREYLEREFNESIKIINPVLQEIKQTDDKIDKMVYELYELTDKEIGIIENSLK